MTDAQGEFIDVSKPRYDQSTYIGRLRHFSEVTDPRNLLATTSQIAAAKQVVSEALASKRVPEGKSSEQVWAAKKLVDSTVHPDTGETIVLPFRMASFVPTNIPILLLMLQSRSIYGIVGSQWINQSANVAFNYANAPVSAGGAMATSETAVAYVSAVGSSCAIAVGLAQWVRRLEAQASAASSVSSGSPSGSSSGSSSGSAADLANKLRQRAAIVGRVSPFVAVAAAGALNVALMRRSELRDGARVRDADGTERGASQAAAAVAISQVAISRVATAFPALLLPAIVMARLQNSSLLRARPALALPANILTISASLLLALPCSIAIFPQIASIDVNRLEPRFQNLLDKNGDPIKRLYFNRGL